VKTRKANPETRIPVRAIAVVGRCKRGSRGRAKDKKIPRRMEKK